MHSLPSGFGYSTLLKLNLPRTPVLPSKTLLDLLCALSVVFKTSQSCSDFPPLLFSTPDLTEFLSTILITCSPSALELLKYLCFLSLCPWPSSTSAQSPGLSHSSPGFSLQVDVANLPEICVSSPVLPTRLSASISSFWLDGHCLLLKFTMTEMELMISPWKAVSYSNDHILIDGATFYLAFYATNQNVIFITCLHTWLPTGISQVHFSLSLLTAWLMLSVFLPAFLFLVWIPSDPFCTQLL